MNVYLQMAEKVLRSYKKPMSAKAILREAYLRDMAPAHIYGKTQHKTLQARLSEDIVRRKEKSLFFRTRPGFFCLKEFSDRYPAFRARRRTRDILKGELLLINSKCVNSESGEKQFIERRFLEKIIQNNWYYYKSRREISSDDIMVLVGAVLVQNQKLLSYRAGRYRDGRDAFVNKKSLLFLSAVTDEDNSFFAENDLGLRDKAIAVIASDLDIAVSELYSAEWKTRKLLKFLKVPDRFYGNKVIIAFMEFETPSSFGPASGKLSLNNLRWLDLDNIPNNTDDFDPYSKLVLSHYLPDLEFGFAQ